MVGEIWSHFNFYLASWAPIKTRGPIEFKLVDCLMGTQSVRVIALNWIMLIIVWDLDKLNLATVLWFGAQANFRQ